jgi:hypothetical protein
MEVLGYLKDVVRTCASILTWGANLQKGVRASLVEDLQSICSNCEDSFGAVLERLTPVKDAFSDPGKLQKELRKFAADKKIRDKFKPEHLCGAVDQLLQRMESNLDGLRYSVDINRIKELKRQFYFFVDYDQKVFQSYDELTTQLDHIATQMTSYSFEPEERARYAQRVIEDFQSELRSTMDAIRQAKTDTIPIL